jgi:hypothetical protein
VPAATAAAVGLAEVAGEHAAAPVQLAHPPPARVLRALIYLFIYLLCYYLISFIIVGLKLKERKRKRRRGGCLGDNGNDVVFVDGEFFRGFCIVGVQHQHLQ